MRALRARVEERRDPLDHASLAGGVAPFKDDDYAQALVLDPLLELKQLDLEAAELLFIALFVEAQHSSGPLGCLSLGSSWGGHGQQL